MLMSVFAALLFKTLTTDVHFAALAIMHDSSIIALIVAIYAA